MMNGVESRVPFVDNYKIVELAYNAESKLKIYDGREKYIVRKYCVGKINDSIVNREYLANITIKAILSEKDEVIKKSRLALLKVTKTVLSNGMNVLGIKPIRKF